MNSTISAFARGAAIVMVAACAAVLPQIVAAQGDSLAGTFNLVPQRSAATPGPVRYKNMTLTFDAGQMTADGVDAKGAPVKGTFMAVPDGKPHPITGITDFDSGSWSKFSDTTTTYSYTRRKTNVVLGSRVLSPDGNVITFNEKTFDDKGKQTGTQTLIYAKPGFETALATPPPPTRAVPAPPPQIRPGTTPGEIAATAALTKGDIDEAIRLYTAAIASSDPAVDKHYDLVARGIAYTRKMQDDLAMKDFDEAIKLVPTDADAKLRRGNIRVSMKQYEGAIEDLNAAIEAQPENANAYALRSFSYFGLQQNEKGGADHDKACALSKELCN